LDEFYISDYFERTRETHLGYGDYRALAEENARCMWHELEGILRGLSISPRNLLDVGCATGGFLAEATSQGLDGVGVELSKYAVGVARNEFNLTVLQGDIYSPELEKGKYDLLTMWHVLEHLIDPLGALERACELLAPRGTLFIELPNWASLGRKVRGQAWKQLKPPEHINFFTPRSLSATVERAGFDVLRCTSEYPSIMNEARQGGPGRLYRLAKAAAATLACKFGCGGYVRLLARKRDLT
jgi:2-polyprenyl-3-methyl-5-hydroxy-6-metoxy-1,4-benzoquinol methylase